MDQDKEISSGKEINIDINGELNSTGVKNMDSDDEPRVGLTKDELMKYANEPFWVRLRNILFGAFWIIWVSILIAAVGYVVQSPNCKMAAAQAVNATQSSVSQTTG